MNIKTVNNFSISVISNRKNQYLNKAIKSILDAGKNYDGNFEILIISDDFENEEFYNNPKIIFIKSDGNVSYKRQLAIEKSRYEWILFIDDDCIADTSILIEYDKKINETSFDRTVTKKTGVIYGQTIFEGEDNIVFNAVKHSPFYEAFRYTENQNEVLWKPTSNALFNKNAALSVGGFDLSNPAKVSGEDVDIGIRLNTSNYKAIICREAIAYHTKETWKKYFVNLKRFHIYGQSAAWLAYKYKERRSFSYDWLIIILVINPLYCFANFRVFALIISLLTAAFYFNIIKTKFKISNHIIVWIVISYILSSYTGYLMQVFSFGIKNLNLIFKRFDF